MNLEEAFLSRQMRDYVVNSCSKEPSLLANLRLETTLKTDAPQMICGPVEGQLLHTLVSISGAKRVLEIGTFTGYSALYMANALGADGKLYTLEIDERHAKVANAYFNRSPDGHKIDLRIGPALDSLETIDETFDLVFIDADKKGYPGYFEAVFPKVRQGGLIIIDNTIWGGRVLKPSDLETKTIAQLNYALSHDSRVDVTMLAIRDGITLCRKI